MEISGIGRCNEENSDSVNLMIPMGACRYIKLLKVPKGGMPNERTVYRVMERIGLCHRPKRKSKGITKADQEARKSDDLLKRDFTADKPLGKCVTDITEIKEKDGKPYVSAIFDCFDCAVLGLEMANHMRVELCVQTLDVACQVYPDLRSAIIHSDRDSQYTSQAYRTAIQEYDICQSVLTC